MPGGYIETSYQCRENFQHLPVKLNVKVIKPQYALAPTSVIKERCKWVTLIVRGCTPSFPVPESNHDSMPNEFIKCLKILRDLQLSPGYITEVHWGLHAWREEKNKDKFLEAYLFSLRRVGKNDPDSVQGDLKMKPHFPDPLASLAFSKGGRQLYVKEGRKGVLVSFMGLGFRHLLCLSAERLRIQIYIKYLSPLYQSPFNEWLLRHCTNE